MLQGTVREAPALIHQDACLDANPEDLEAAARVMVSVRTNQGVADLLSQLDDLVAGALRTK